VSRRRCGALNSFTAGLAAGTVTHGSLVDTVLSSADSIPTWGRSRDFTFAGLPPRARSARTDQLGELYAAGQYPGVGGGRHLSRARKFQLTYGTLDDTQYVTLLYENVLGRQPDPDGIWPTGPAAAGVTTRGNRS